MDTDKTSMIYQLFVFSEADRIGIIDHDAYKEFIKMLLDLFKEMLTDNRRIVNGYTDER